MPSTKCKLLFIAIGLLVFASRGTASPWPIEASIAYVEEFQLACAEVQPEAQAKFEARKRLLYSEAPERVSEAKASQMYSQARVWARNVIRQRNTVEMSEDCTSFLTHSNLAFKQEDADRGKPVPVDH